MDSSGTESSQESDICETKSQLKEKNALLMRELATLKSQFSEAVSLPEEMEKLHAENAKLSAQLRSLSAEKEDLAHRLQISMQAAQELKDKMASQKKGFESQMASEQGNKEKEFKKVKNQSESEVKKWRHALAVEKKEREEEKVEHSMLVNKVERLMQNAERYFETKFASCDDLIELLGQPPVVVVAEGGDAKECAHVQRLERHVRKLKAKLREASATKAESEEQREKFKKTVQEMQASAKQEQARLQARIAELTEEKAALKEKSRCDLEKVKAEVEHLRCEITAVKQKSIERKQRKEVATAPLEPVSRIQPIQLPTKLEKEFQATQEHLMNKVSELTDQVCLSEKKKDEMADKLRQAEMETQGVRLELERQKNDFLTLSVINKEAQSEINALRAALHAKPKEEVPVKPPKKVSKKPTERLKKEVETQKQQVVTLSADNQKKKTQIEDYERRVRELEAEVREAEERAKKAASEFHEYRLKVESKRKPKKDEILPPQAFVYSEFEPALSKKLSEIGSNTALQPASKVQSCYKAIAKHYRGVVDKVKGELDQTLEGVAALKSQINKLLVDASIALNDKPITFDDAFTAAVGESFIRSIAGLRASYDAAVHKVETLAAVIAHFNQTFEEEGDPIECIDHVKQRCVAQSNELCRKSKRCKLLKTQLVACQRQLAETIEDAKCEGERLRSEISQLEQNLSHSEAVVKKLRLRTQELGNQLAAEKVAKDELERSLTDSYEEQLSSLNAEMTAMRLQLTKDLETSQSNYAQLKSEYEEGQELIQKLRKHAQSQKVQLKRQQTQLEELEQLIAANEEKARQVLEAEKAQLTESFETTVTELREQCDRHREDLQKVVAQLAQAEANIKHSQCKCCELQKAKRRLENDITQLNEQIAREKRLMESAQKAKILAIETQCNNRIEEAQAKFENEQRTMCAFVADNFRSFHNPCQQLDCASIRFMLEKVRDELQRLRKSDREIRQMLGAFDGQNTQDAVARYLLDHH